MAHKRLYLSNSSALYGPSELTGLGGARALVLGRSIDFSSFQDLRNYFSVIISEDLSYSSGLYEPPDVEFWQQGSPYVQSVFSYPIEQDVLYCTNYGTLRAFSGLQRASGTYNLAYLPGGTVGTMPSVVRGLPIGLDQLVPGVHLAKVMGASEIWDTEGRSGSILATTDSVSALINDIDKYGISSGLLGQRLALLEKI